MLGNYNVYASLAVKDLAVSASFYGGKLGLQVEKETTHQCLYNSGTNKLQVYTSHYAGTNKATAVFWEVDDVEAEVTQLKNNGVEFEHFPDMPGVQLDGDIHSLGHEKAAWLKDPDGNMLCIHNA